MRIDINLYRPGRKTRLILQQLYAEIDKLESIRKVVYFYQSDILRSNFWKNDAEIEQYNSIGIMIEEHIITDPDHTYLLSRANLDKYRRLCFHEARKRGLMCKTPLDCPIRNSEGRVHRLKNKIAPIIEKEMQQQNIFYLSALRRVDYGTYQSYMESILADLVNQIKVRRNLQESEHNGLNVSTKNSN